MGNAVSGTREWGSFYGSGRGTVYPDENLVRLVKGDYADVPRSGRVLDVGFGRGANLVMFAENGYESHGLEVSSESIASASALAEEKHVAVRLGLLEGTTLPYRSDHFDLVVSWNAVYYFGTRSLVGEAIDDFHRVLRPGGVLLLSVIHPNSFMVRRLSDDTGDGSRRIDRPSPYDNRLDLQIYYDGTSTGWRKHLHRFEHVEEGYAESDLFVPSRRDAWRLFYARKHL